MATSRTAFLLAGLPIGGGELVVGLRGVAMLLPLEPVQPGTHANLVVDQRLVSESAQVKMGGPRSRVVVKSA
ncbi:hypothetical protein GCM10010272_70070 [Streptomyces lateritius]|nr:hypothetical protein GCM10010272_70070 [Streptomyces lateritius]